MAALDRKLARFRTHYGPWAVIAGGSEGLGAEFAAQLAARGLNLLLIARRAEPLNQLAVALQQEHGVEVRSLVLDLASPEVADAVREAVDGVQVGLVVCSAAVSQMAPFLELSLADKLRAVDVNCRATLAITHVLGQRLAAQRRGGIIIMSSLAGLFGGPYVATYAATKAFGCVLAESLSAELDAFGVDVLACVAGPTRTPTYERQLGDRMHPMPPRTVVTAALRALGRRPRVITGAFNRLVTWILTRMPRAWVLSLVAGRTRRSMDVPPQSELH